MKKGDTLPFTITGYAFEGRGIARVPQEDGGEFVVFVDGAYPGDTVAARIHKKKKNYAEAKTSEVLTPSPYRVAPKCRYMGVCGGCKQQDLSYPQQAAYKQQQVEETLTRLGGISGVAVNPILTAAEQFYYRNKMEYSFAHKRYLFPNEMGITLDEGFLFYVGLHIPGLYDKVIDLQECWLQSPESVAIVDATRRFFRNTAEAAYGIKNRGGYLRNLAVRQARHTGNLMVNLVTSADRPELMLAYTAALLAEVPAITTVVNNVSQNLSLVAYGDYENVYHGPGYITDTIGGLRYRISANSFFQTNTAQAEQLYAAALRMARLNGSEVLYDLYCGAGTITLYAARFAKQAFGFEAVPSAIADAAVNQQLNASTNTTFFTADLNKSFLPIVQQHGVPAPDVVIADPPRGGMHANTVADLLALQPPVIVYVSCNPATQARDVKLLAAGGYSATEIQPVDMFPHTFHIENIIRLERN